MEVGRRGPFDGGRFAGWFGRIELPWKARVVTGRLHRQLTALDGKIGSEVREPTLRIGGRTLGPAAGHLGPPEPPRPPGPWRSMSWPVRPGDGRPGRGRGGAAGGGGRPAGATVRLPIGERPPERRPGGGPGRPPTGPPPLLGAPSR
jgi:hypothetical protein